MGDVTNGTSELRLGVKEGGIISLIILRIFVADLRNIFRTVANPYIRNLQTA